MGRYSGWAQFSMMALARSAGALPRRSATPCSVMMTWTECSLLSRWLTIGTMVLILPPLAVEGQVKIERKALRAKSPEPPMPFIMFRPRTWVLLTLPVMSTSMAVLMEMMPRRRTTSGLLLISWGRSRSRGRKNSMFIVNVLQDGLAHGERATAGKTDFSVLASIRSPRPG